MSAGAQRGSFDARMRRLFASVDTSPEFRARLMARVAAMDALPTEELRERIERRKRVASQRLRREAWLNAATAAGLGAAGVAFFLRQGPVAARWTDALVSAASDPSVLGQLAVAVLAVALWPVVRVFLPR